MTLRDYRGPPRNTLLGCGALLALAAPAAGLLALRSWRQGDPASDFVGVAVVCAVVSAIFLSVGWWMTKRAGG